MPMRRRIGSARFAQRLLLLPLFVFLAFLFSIVPFVLQTKDIQSAGGFWIHFHDYGVRWIPWGFLMPMLIAFVRRFPFYKSDWFFSMAVHLAGSIVMAFAQLGLAVGLNRAMLSLGLIGAPALSFPKFAAEYFNMSVLTYWILALTIAGIDSQRKYRDREVRALELETELAKAQLQSLKTQIEPHFLFNTLHAVSGLVYRDPKAADTVLSRLSRLIRSTLEFSEDQEIPFEREVDILKAYIEIMIFRFGDRIKVETDIAPDTLQAWAPSFLLQPLVENAFRHGILPKIDGGTVRVRSLRRDGRLVVGVSDDGLGFAKDAIARAAPGLGLTNIRKRLEMLYGARHEFLIRNGPEGGAEITVAIPFREAPTGTSRGRSE
jgi:two-component system LytT family sensor kinase